MTRRTTDSATAGVIKDAGDDPDVTHGALVCATVRVGAPGAGVTFRAGEGVGTVTRAGLPLPPGEPAINPVPRADDPRRHRRGRRRGRLRRRCRRRDLHSRRRERSRQRRSTDGSALSAACRSSAPPASSCRIPARPGSIRSIRGIDVARAAGLTHIAGATGASSEAAVQKLYGLPEIALIDMGDFVGGMLKYLRRHPVPRVTIAGGVAKMTKLAQGLTDLHSKRGERRSRGCSRICQGGGRLRRPCARASSRPTRPPKPLRSRTAEGIALGDEVAHAAQANGRAILSPAATSRSKSWCSIASRIWSAARRSKSDCRSCGASPESAAVIRIIERAIAKIIRAASARPTRMSAVRSIARRRDLRGDVGERAAQDRVASGVLACTTTAAGQSAP